MIAYYVITREEINLQGAVVHGRYPILKHSPAVLKPKGENIPSRAKRAAFILKALS